MEGFFLCNGNETQEIVKPSGEHDFRGSLEWSAQGNLEYLTGASGERTWKKIKGRAILHTDK